MIIMLLNLYLQDEYSWEFLPIWRKYAQRCAFLFSTPSEGYMIQTFNCNTRSDVMLLTVQICTPNKASAIATQGLTKQKA